MIGKSILITALVVTLSACTNYGAKTGGFAKNTVSETRVPPSIQELTIESDGSRMSGIAYLAAGAGPHPTVMLLHGYPGNEKNLDVAQALRRNGWNVVFFHYRGAWGSEGDFSIKNAEHDVRAVYAYLNTPKNQQKLRINSRQISLVGHSMGGHMAIAGLLDLPTARCAVSYDGANMGAGGGKGLFSDPRLGKVWRDYTDSLFMLKGWSGEKAVEELTLYGAELDLVSRVDTVGGRPVLLISADTKVVPEATHITPLYEALRATENSRAEYLLIKDDHSFSANRLELIEATQNFLDRNCR